MPKKIGRPIMGDQKKDRVLSFRVTDDTYNRLNECAQILGCSKVVFLEDMVNSLYQRVTKEAEQ